MSKLAQKITLYYSVITALLILCHIVVMLLCEYSLLPRESILVQIFDLNKEKNAPALFSTFGLFLSGIILILISWYEKVLNRYAWFALGVIFFFLAYDEFFAVHENLIIPVRDYFKASGYFYFAWVIPYGAALIILTLLFYNFVKSLPAGIKSLIIISGIIYVSGAWGLELFGGNQYVNDGEVQTLTFRILYTIEESLEMSAIALFIYAVSKYLATLRHYVTVSSKEILNTRISNVYGRTGTF